MIFRRRPTADDIIDDDKPESIMQWLRRRMKWNSPMHDPEAAFQLGERVAKLTGDYTFQGTVVGIVRKLSGQLRYVVEDDRGLLLILNKTQLIKSQHNPEEYV